MRTRWIVSAIDRRNGERRELYSLFAQDKSAAILGACLKMSKEWRGIMMIGSLKVAEVTESEIHDT